MVLENGGIKISTFGAFWAKIRGENTPNEVVRSAGAWTVALGAQSQRANAGRCSPGTRRPVRDNNQCCLASGALGATRMVPRRSLEGILLMFSLIYLLEHHMLILALDFIKWEETWFLRRTCFAKTKQWLFLRIMMFLLVYCKDGLKGSMQACYRTIISWNFIFGKIIVLW